MTLSMPVLEALTVGFALVALVGWTSLIFTAHAYLVFRHPEQLP